MNTKDTTKDETMEATTPTKPHTPENTKRQPIFDSAELFSGENEILIAHAGAHYRLRITRQGKLILNK